VEWERSTWRVSWQDGPNREALMGPGGRAGRVSGGSLPGRGLALARSNSAVAIALAWLARGSAKSPAAARAAIPEVEAFCADTGRNTPLAAEVGLCCTGTTLAMRRHELADEASAFDRQTTTARTRPRISARPLRRRGDDADEPSNGTSAVRSWRPWGGAWRGRHAGWLAQHRRGRCGHDGVARRKWHQRDLSEGSDGAAR